MTISYPEQENTPKSSTLSRSDATWNPSIAGQAVAEGLYYLQNRLGWSGTRIAHTLHLPANTMNTWLKKGSVPITSTQLQPDIQAIIHLLAIHRSLEAMFENPAHQQAWLSTFHPELKVVPEKLMAESIDGLIFVRQYLDYVRGRGA
ncbi:MAG TPA: antitoxin Xre/MbcA/ParS toxin-binding domain-containing protein [Gammaproteobacteria bacterium]|jgi:hypothetical protein|nr:antitoxin Xre/MbcA/ParS toxin-binding domain-containing protein [Gammaproteobacteria bacterium]